MGRHDATPLTHARNELMSHVIRCDVLEAQHESRFEWLDETMDYMADRYPQLSELQLAKLELIGRQFIKPVIPHGRGSNALTRETPESMAA